jgi:serine/threonine protein kinase
MTQIERIGRFEILERIRGNSFSLVYRGRDPFADRAVEIKVCIARDEAIRKRFLLAAEKAATLRHANIATIFEFGSGESKPYLVQEAFSAWSLSDLLARGEHVEDILKLFYLVQVARGLDHAHRRGVLHKELRPASVLVHDDGRVQIADFGIARLASATAQLGDGAHRWPAVGWLLPELLLGLELDARSDIYSFGALAYEILAGEPPFVAQTLADLIPQVLECEPVSLTSVWPECSPELDQIIGTCLRRDPSQRYPQISALIEDLSEVVPVSDDDIEEEEKTIVTPDLQTIYVAEQENQEEDSQLEAVPVEPSHGPTWIDTTRTASREMAAMTGRFLAASIARARQVRLPRISTRVLWRPASLAAMAIVLLGVVAWGLGRKSTDLAAVSSSQPGSVDRVTEPEPPGLLVIDAQPWAQVSRLVNEKGDEISLPHDSFTPLPLELPPGLYLATLQQPGSRINQKCEALVSEVFNDTATTEIYTGIGVQDYFRETGWWQ